MAAQRTTEIERFHDRLDPTSVALSESRAAFEGWLSGTAVGEDVAEDLMVVFSELVANAVRASAAASGQVEASAWAEPGKIVLRVANPVEQAAAPVSQPDLADPLRTGGRGLVIIRAYTDTLRTEVHDETIVIHCERRTGG